MVKRTVSRLVRRCFWSGPLTRPAVWSNKPGLAPLSAPAQVVSSLKNSCMHHVLIFSRSSSPFQSDACGAIGTRARLLITVLRAINTCSGEVPHFPERDGEASGCKHRFDRRDRKCSSGRRQTQLLHVEHRKPWIVSRWSNRGLRSALQAPHEDCEAASTSGVRWCTSASNRRWRR